MLKQLSLPLLFLFLQSCAVGPLYNYESARSLGSRNHDLKVGYGNVGAKFAWNYGATENLDIGFQYETLSVGFKAKYAFINNTEGYSLATNLGTGGSLGGSYYHVDLLTSYKKSWFEPYFNFRYVHLSLDEQEFNEEKITGIKVKIEKDNYSYFQPMLGTLIWFGPNFYLGLESSFLIAKGDRNFLLDSFIYGANLGLTF